MAILLSTSSVSSLAVNDNHLAATLMQNLCGFVEVHVTA